MIKILRVYWDAIVSAHTDPYWQWVSWERWKDIKEYTDKFDVTDSIHLFTKDQEWKKLHSGFLLRLINTIHWYIHSLNIWLLSTLKIK